MMAKQAGFFDVDDRLKRLSDLGDQLEAYAAAVDFEIFRADLEKTLAYSDGSKGGRPPYDAVLMFKILIIQAQNNLSDDRAEFLISDRLSFMRFLGLGLHDRVPDAKTIWAFRERLTQARAIEGLFTRFDGALKEAGYIAMSGQLVDSSLIAAPKQRNTKEEKAAIKEGKTAEEIWSDSPAKARQKDGLSNSPKPVSVKTVPRRLILPSRHLATRRIQGSTSATASFADGTSPARQLMMGACCDEACWTSRTRDLVYGRTALIAQRRTRLSSISKASPVTSITANPRAVPCQSTSGAETRHDQNIARLSSMFMRFRKTYLA